MKANRLLRTIVILLLLALNIGCDQVSKSIVRKKMDVYTYYGFLHDHITVARVENSGAFLSVGDSLSKPMKMILLNIFPLIFIIFGFAFILVKPNLPRAILFGLILVVGGGFGNLYDRVVHGSVTDFLHINFVIFQTGIFNVADMSIMAGMFLMLFYTIFKKKDEVEEPGFDESQV